MNLIDSLGTGFAVALTPENLLYVLIGCAVGTVIGVLPGLGPTTTIALLLPLTYTVPPASAVILLAGIYYGSMYGGTITSVLLRMPGQAASVVTTFDGHQMARQGRAGHALGIAAIGSFVGGILAVVGLAALAIPMAELALTFGPAEYAALAALGIVLVAYLGTRSFAKSMVMACLGLLLAVVGPDPITGAARFAFGSPDLYSGLDLIAVAMGLFGIGELLYTAAHPATVTPITGKVGGTLPSRAEIRASGWPIARGSVLGFFIGVLPGGGGLMGSLASYAAEKRIAKDPSRCGKGAIEGVAGPETANNASSTSAFIPLLTLGLPSNVVLALIYGALLIQGITPGPSLVRDYPDVFWGVIASMVVGNAVLLLLNLPLVGLFVRILRVRSGVLASVAIVITLIGVYSVNNRVFDMWVVLGFGVVGYGLRRLGFEPGPLVLAFVLGALLERSFRQAMLISDGSLAVFLTRPLALAIVAAMALLLIANVWTALRPRRTVPPMTQQDTGGDAGTNSSADGRS
ncbi:tripartite tricarboxylate transporter permease [Pseudonocardia nigra]|uniref:tripartite tricarboxylate transporter permease n=1 Tax=Pseudonocardia nigra TaxID=1921578 RepID=UPI001C5F4BAF|nr:tripartite tricarboxylate transporter permease [Pseudonocardia nigra]